MEARGQEAGGRVEGAEIEQRVDVGCEKVGEVGEGVQVGRRHGGVHGVRRFVVRFVVEVGGRPPTYGRVKDAQCRYEAGRCSRAVCNLVSVFFFLAYHQPVRHLSTLFLFLALLGAARTSIEAAAPYDCLLFGRELPPVRRSRARRSKTRRNASSTSDSSGLA